MIKTETENLLELGDQVTCKYHPEIKGVVAGLTRSTQGVITLDIEQYLEDTGSLIGSRMYISDAIGENGETFSCDPKDYDNYFPRYDNGEYKFQLNIEYTDIYTPSKGIAISHGVCITGCDMTKLSHYKKDAGLYILTLDLNRIKRSDDPDGKTCESLMSKDRGDPPGAPAYVEPATLD